MIPGFEDPSWKRAFRISKTNFPEDYFKKDLAGVEAEFNINLKEVQELKVAKLDEELFENSIWKLKMNEF